MDSPFDSPKALLVRARRHIEELEFQIRLFNQTKPYRAFRERKPSLGQEFIKIAVSRPLPDQLPCIVFDAVNTLRSSLDHAVFAATVLWTKDFDVRATKFPFADKEDDLGAEFKRGARSVPEPIRIYLRALKPYESGNRSLWGLNKIRNTKIHQVLVPSALTGAMKFNGGWIGSMVTINQWDARNNELIFAVSPLGQMGEFEADFSIQISFAQTTPFARRNVAETLNELLSMCEGIITGLEAESDRVLQG